MGQDRPTSATSMEALGQANRALLRAMGREKRAAKAHAAALVVLREAKRHVALLVAAISQP
jgi:hypothetical protein